MSLMYGRYHYGRYIFAGRAHVSGSTPVLKPTFLPGQVQIIAYAKDGTKTDIYGTGVKNVAFSQLQFELVETGSGTCTITFKTLPAVSRLTYGQRIDVHLYGDYRPWYSGYVLNIPVKGGTQEEFKVTCHGYYNRLKNKLVFDTYENMEISMIVRDIILKAESTTEVKYNPAKVQNVGYTVSYIKFDGVSVQEALKQLSEFAYDYVYGVDEYQDVYFKERSTAINEEARLWVSKHIHGFEPSVNVDKLVNWARIKGAANDEETGEVWLTTVEDVDSQNKYGRYEKTWTLPSAYKAADVEQWGKSELARYKEPIESAKVKDLKLEYPKKNEYWVRKLSTEGKALVVDKDGSTHTYPITKIEYTVNADSGIKAEMELGEPPFRLDKYLFDIERNARNTELLEQASRDKGVI